MQRWNFKHVHIWLGTPKHHPAVHKSRISKVKDFFYVFFFFQYHFYVSISLTVETWYRTRFSLKHISIMKHWRTLKKQFNFQFVIFEKPGLKFTPTTNLLTQWINGTGPIYKIIAPRKKKSENQKNRFYSLESKKVSAWLLLRTDLPMETGWRGTMPVFPLGYIAARQWRLYPSPSSLPGFGQSPRLWTITQASLWTAWKHQEAGVMVGKDEYQLTKILNSASASN